MQLSNINLTANKLDGLYLSNSTQINASLIIANNHGGSGIWIEENCSEINFQTVSSNQNQFDGISVFNLLTLSERAPSITKPATHLLRLSLKSNQAYLIAVHASLAF